MGIEQQSIKPEDAAETREKRIAQAVEMLKAEGVVEFMLVLGVMAPTQGCNLYSFTIEGSLLDSVETGIHTLFSVLSANGDPNCQQQDSNLKDLN